MRADRNLTSLIVVSLVAALPFVASCKRSRGSASGPATAGSTAVPADDPDGPFIAEIDLSRGVPEVSAAGLFKSEQGTVIDLIENLRAAAKKPKMRGAFVRFGYAPLGWGRGRELARALSAVRDAGKPVICQGESFGNGTYWLAASACDEIWLAPAGGLDTIGLASESIHAAPLLAKLGIAVDVLQIGTRDSPSEEYRSSLGGTLGDLRQQWLDGTVRARKNEALREVLERGPYAPNEAKRLGLVENVGYVDEARDHARRQANAGHVEQAFGSGKTNESKSGMVDLVRALSGGRSHGGGPPYIALVRASGAIDMEKSGGPLSRKDSGI